MDKLDEVINLIKQKVTDYVNDNQKKIPNSILEDQGKLSHIIDVGCSIMRTKWNVGYPGGSFAQAIVDNNLSASFGRADETCCQCMHFYVMMVNNLDMPIKVWEYKKENQFELSAE